MRLNDLKPAIGAKHAKLRLGRGMGSGLGKTCGFGHKGQKARSGCSRRAGFEGGQTPLYRRLPKFGFSSPKSRFSKQLTLTELNRSELTEVSIAQLVNTSLVPVRTERVKVVLSGKIDRAVTIACDVKVTAGARAAIEAAGGKILCREKCAGNCTTSDEA